MSISSGVFVADITHGSFPEMRWVQIRFELSSTLDDTKEKLHRHVGSSPAAMDVYIVYDNLDTGKACKTIWDDAADACTLGTFLENSVAGTPNNTPVGIHVIDKDPSSTIAALGASMATSNVNDRYRMSEEEYAKRSDSARTFLKTLKENNPKAYAASSNTNNTAARSTSAGHSRRDLAPSEVDIDGFTIPQVTASHAVGTRCSVAPGDRRGLVAWVGRSTKSSSVRIGVALDEPLGDSDGTHPSKQQGGGAAVQLFECAGPRYGVFAHPNDVACGDYPPVDPFDLDEI